MPIVDVEIVLKTGEQIPGEMVSELADQLGHIFGSRHNGTWVKVHGLPAIQYAENGGKDEAVFPVFVSVLKSRLAGTEELQKEVHEIVAAVAQVCSRPPSLVHVNYLPEATGRVAFGGKIVS